MAREQWRSLLGRLFNTHHIPDSRLGTLLKLWAGAADTAKQKTPAEKAEEAKTLKVPNPLFGPLSHIVGKRKQAALNAIPCGVGGAHILPTSLKSQHTPTVAHVGP